MTTQLQAPVDEPPVTAPRPVVSARKRSGLLARIGASLLRGNEVYADLATNHPMK